MRKIEYDIDPYQTYYATTAHQRDDTLRLGMHHAEYFSPDHVDDNKNVPIVIKKFGIQHKDNVVIYCTCLKQESSFICLQELFSDDDNDKPIFGDQEFDKTDYKYLEKFKDMQTSTSPEEFKEFNSSLSILRFL